VPVWATIPMEKSSPTINEAQALTFNSNGCCAVSSSDPRIPSSYVEDAPRHDASAGSW
jgi:hypothetical protein